MTQAILIMPVQITNLKMSKKKYPLFNKISYSLIFLLFTPSVFADSIAIQKAYAASILGGNLCFLRQGRLTKQSFVLNVENLMLKKGYDLDHLYKDDVRKAGKLIANKLDNDCTSQDFLRDESFMFQIANILR